MAHSQWLQNRPQLKALIHFMPGGLRHHKATVWQELDQSLPFKLAQRFANRHLASVEFGSDQVLTQRFATGERAGDDGFSDNGRNKLRCGHACQRDQACNVFQG
ncbi:hypothetical protein D9M71_796690 [compost metagenome]